MSITTNEEISTKLNIAINKLLNINISAININVAIY